MSTAGPELGRPALAAITLSPNGGGIAAVSRLVRDVLAEVSLRPVHCIELATDHRRFDTTTLDRVRFGARVASTQMTKRCDWLFYTHLNLAAVQRFVPRRLARPYAVFLHDVEGWTPLGASMRRILDGAFVRLANSRYTAERVLAANPGCRPVVACPLAVQSPATGGPIAADIEVGPRTVVIVGRMMSSERYKGHDQLIEAWPDVVAQVPDAVLMCVGEGDDVGRLREKARGVGVLSSVRFPGFVDETARGAIYRSAAALAMPSRREGFGLVYVEAMAAGVPCIGSLHDAASEVIVDGETGFLVSQEDRPGLVRRIVELLRDEALRRRLGGAGRQRYGRLFTVDAFRERLIGHITAALPAKIERAREHRHQAGAA
ncbi:MAG: glycosyltransferase family 4 protein [Acidobacteria bacterium]|nr:glycosyltransferase family 4 protein [Acidobacteriota bacterium]